MSIVCIGQCTYDMTFPIETPLVENQKYRVLEPFACIGGPATNAAYLCALWNVRTTLVSRCGTDFYGKEICDTLEKVGVDISHLIIDPTIETPRSAIIANACNGYRTIFNCPGKLQELCFTFPTKPRVLLLDGHELKASIEALNQFPDAESVMDAGTYHEETKDIAQRVNYLVCSQNYAEQYSQTKITLDDEGSWKQAFDTLCQLNSGIVVITLGENGLLYKEHNVIYHIPSFSVSAIDTTGAGDIFHGAFAYCLYNGYSLRDTLIICSAASAIAVQILGGQTSIPQKQDVQYFLESHDIYLKLK